MTESRQDDLINVVETFFENYIEKMIQEDQLIDLLEEKYQIYLDAEERDFIKEQYVSHLILDTF